MNDLTKYHDQVIEDNVANIDRAPGSGSPSIFALIPAILRRWYIVLLIFILMCGAGIPAIWLLKKPVYSVTGAIRVAPILTNILSGEADKGEISNYEAFMNTQAVIITSNQVVQRVADDLADKDLEFLKNPATTLTKKFKQRLKGTEAKPEEASVLKEALTDGVIGAAADRRSELIRVTMENKNADEAKQVVDAFIRAYMAIEVSSFAEAENQKLSLLENERKAHLQKMQEYRQTISQLAQEYGDKKLEDRRDMKLGRVASLLAKVTEYEAQRIYLEAKVELLEQTEDSPGIGAEEGTEGEIGPKELLEMRNTHMNNDPTIKDLAYNITQLEQGLIIARQELNPSNPELKRKEELIETLKSRLTGLKEEAGKTFDELVAERTKKAKEEKLLYTQTQQKQILRNARSELELIKTHEERFRELLAKEDTETISVGRTQVAIQDLQDQLTLTKETYGNINRRIKELEMQLKRPARISIAYAADVALVKDKRAKLTLALVFGAMACGILPAFLLAKADQTLRTPDDVAKSIGVRILGTTTGLRYVKEALLCEQLAEDYQIIRENIGLLGDDGEEIPKKLVVASPGPREGKTTFAINLATSISRSGKKVLLIDGDLRKPDIAHLLDIPEGSRGLHDVLVGREIEDHVYHTSTGLDVLAADSKDASQAYELLAIFHKAQYIDKISERYDHIIIDTPPALIFPDTFVWAKIASSVILTSFAGQTTATALKEVKQRLSQIDVSILGTVLSNVRVDRSYGYYRQAHDYYKQNGRAKATKRADKKTFLLPMRENKENVSNS